MLLCRQSVECAAPYKQLSPQEKNTAFCRPSSVIQVH